MSSKHAFDCIKNKFEMIVLNQIWLNKEGIKDSLLI